MARKSDQVKAIEESADPAPDPAPVAETATVADLGAILADEMPEVQRHAVDMAKAEAEGIETPETPPSADPQPVKRGRGRPPGSGKKSKVAKPGDTANVAKAPPEQDQTAAIAMSAGALTSITLLAGTIIGGPDFAPGPNPLVGGKNDQEFLQAAYFDYCKAKGVQDVPPGVALTAALMIYITPRLSKPQTQNRLGFIGKWIGAVWAKIRKRKGNNAAHIHRGDDGIRQNHISAEA